MATRWPGGIFGGTITLPPRVRHPACACPARARHDTVDLRSQSAFCRATVGKLLILRLTTRGLCRPRLRSAGIARISIRRSAIIRRRRRGGKRGVERHMAADDPHRVQEGQGVGVDAGVAAGIGHQPAQGQVHEHKP